MKTSELLAYINRPYSMDEKAVGELQKLVNDFPYFQAGHILLSLAAKKWDTSVYQQSLKKTAIAVNNRSHLFQLLHAPEPRAAVDSPQPTPTHAQDVNDALKESLQKPDDTRQELDILKAAELSVENKAEEKVTPGEAPKPDLTEAIEKEMGKQLISSYLQKEILKTTGSTTTTKPVEEPANFNEWLSYFRNRSDKGPIQKPAITQVEPETPKAEEPNKQAEVKQNDPLQQRKQKNRALIDKIIESSPGHIKVKEDQKFYTADNKAKESLQDNEHLVTETLARIYALQGNVNKAVRAYEILSLKFPQKSAYFATLIEKLKNN